MGSLVPEQSSQKRCVGMKDKKLLLLPFILILTLLVSYFAYSISVGTTAGGQISLANVTRMGKEGVMSVGAYA